MRTIINSGGYLCVAIPTIKRHDLGVKSQHTNRAVAEIRNSRVCINNSPRIYFVSSPMGRGLAFDYHQNTLFTSILCFLQIKILISRPRVFDRHHTDIADLIGILFLCVLDRINLERPSVCDGNSPP